MRGLKAVSMELVSEATSLDDISEGMSAGGEGVLGLGSGTFQRLADEK